VGPCSNITQHNIQREKPVAVGTASESPVSEGTTTPTTRSEQSEPTRRLIAPPTRIKTKQKGNMDEIKSRTEEDQSYSGEKRIYQKRPTEG